MRSTLSWVATVLAFVAGLNLILVGLKSFSVISHSWDIFAWALGGVPWLAAIVYILAGLGVLWLVFKWGDKK